MSTDFYNYLHSDKLRQIYGSNMKEFVMLTWHVQE